MTQREKTRRKKPLAIVTAFVAATLAALLLAACNGDDGNNGADTEPQGTSPTRGIDYASLAGAIRVDGSSTVFPISEAVAEEFQKVTDTQVNEAFSGTGGGFEKFCRDEIEISDASRPIKQEELDACAGTVLPTWSNSRWPSTHSP